MIKNRKSCSVADVIPVGADAVTAEKLAVDELTNEVDILTYCFLKYTCSPAEPKPLIYCFAAYSVTNAVELLSVNEVSFDISFTLCPPNI